MGRGADIVDGELDVGAFLAIKDEREFVGRLDAEHDCAALRVPGLRGMSLGI